MRQILKSLSLELGPTDFPSGFRGTLRDSWSEPEWSGPLTKNVLYNSQGDSFGDKGKSKGGGKMNEEISSDSESER